MPRSRFAWLLLAACLCLAPAGCRREPEGVVVLIGGASSEKPGRHEYALGLARLQDWIERADMGLQVRAYPRGWPDDPAAFEGAETVVLYFEGDTAHPLRDPARRAAFEALVRRGVGIVALHQASTVPRDGSLRLSPWLGAERRGLYDRTTETVRVQPAAHPVARGVSAFSYRDEFYPTLHAEPGARAVVQAVVHVQYRDGASVVEDRPQRSTLGWAYQRPDGGRSFVYTGTHFLSAFEQPALRALLLNAVAWTARREAPEIEAVAETGAPASAGPVAVADAHDVPTFQRDAARSGWYPNETALTSEAVAGSGFNLVWESPALARDASGQAPRLYASPLYLDRVRIGAGQHAGETFSVAFAATSNGDVYAINAAPAGDVVPGRILWRRALGAPCRLQPAPLDGVPTGILSTPVIDVARGRIYVTHCDPARRWQAYALDLGSGRVLPDWPVRLDEATFNRINANRGPRPVPPSRKHDFRVQRGALNLSPDGGLLYVVFGETETGWVVAVDTRKAQVASAYASVAMPRRSSGGIWGAGGPAVDGDGALYVATGTGYDGYADRPHDWTQSLIRLAPNAGGKLRLTGTYTPFNHCSSAEMDIDLGSGGASLLPQASANGEAGRLLALGGKQGNVYLLDRDALPGRLDRRPPCSKDASTDASLLPPGPQPQFGTRGPLNAFGPYSETDAALDLARARSVPAGFRDAQGRVHVFATGTSKRAAGVADSVPPSLVRLDVMHDGTKNSYLRIAAKERTIAMRNPGSPVVSSDGAQGAVVWVLDENAPRSAMLSGADPPRPVLYAFDAMTLRPLWRSAPGLLHTSGKYNAPAIARGQVLVGTDRVQAFGLGPALRKTSPPAPETGAPDPAPAAASAPPPGTKAGPPADGAAIYRTRCAVCHDHPTGNIPPRAVIASRGRARIVQALAAGVMRPQAAGLTATEIEAVAEHLQ